jgi:hypothetical protein
MVTPRNDRVVLGFPLEVSQDGDRLVERRRRIATLMAAAIGLGQQDHIKEIGVGLEPLPRPVAESLFDVATGRR